MRENALLCLHHLPHPAHTLFHVLLPVILGQVNKELKSRLQVTALSTIVSLVACTEGTEAERLARLHLPPPDYVADSTRGAELFARRCAECHGVNAQGSKNGPPLVSPVYRPEHHANLAFHWAVRDGVRQHHWKFGDMPAQKDVTPEEAADIVGWVRLRQREAGIE